MKAQVLERLHLRLKCCMVANMSDCLSGVKGILHSVRSLSSVMVAWASCFFSRFIVVFLMSVELVGDAVEE